MAEKVAKVGIKKKPGYLYFVDKRGAHEHNLQYLDLVLPHNRLVGWRAGAQDVRSFQVWTSSVLAARSRQGFQAASTTPRWST